MKKIRKEVKESLFKKKIKLYVKLVDFLLKKKKTRKRK